MASLKGWRSASTDEPVSAGELARLGATMASRGLALLLLCGGALPHKKLIRSSLRMVLRRFFTQANMSCNPMHIIKIWEFMLQKEAYTETLQHNLTHISQEI